MVGVEAKDLEHALDFERWHDAVVRVDADEVHVRVLFGPLARSVVAKVSTDPSDTVEKSDETKQIILKMFHKRKRITKKITSKLTPKIVQEIKSARGLWVQLIVWGESVQRIKKKHSFTWCDAG